jgi:hypothetical protein
MYLANVQVIYAIQVHVNFYHVNMFRDYEIDIQIENTYGYHITGLIRSGHSLIDLG